MMTQSYRDLYEAAKLADEVFHAAVIKQFGRHNAGDMRYRSTKHNAETKAAAKLYQQASDALRAALYTSNSMMTR